MATALEPEKQQRAEEAGGSPLQHEEHAFDVNSPLVSLSPDALISVLCRVPACDHTALWNTCRLLRETIDSDVFASERAATNWAEVTARHVPKEELYDRENPNGPHLWSDDDSYDPKEEINNDNLTEEERDKQQARKRRWEEKRESKRQEELETYYSDLGSRDESYGSDDITIDIKVDGIKSGEVALVRVPRPQYGYRFHAATDAHSRELQQVGWALCDRRGRPKMRSIKQADTDGKAKWGGFLHINTVRISKAYRSNDNTNVVARAVRAAITVPELEGMWTLATAMCDPNVYMVGDDKEMKREAQRSRYRWENDIFGNTTDRAALAEEQEKYDSWLDGRFNRLLELDARTLMRVGYNQIPEVVGTKRNEPAWLFALPPFLEDPILSHEEAAAIKLIQPPDYLPPDPRGVDKELFALVKRTCNNRRNEMTVVARVGNELDNLEQKVRKEWDEEVESIEKFDEVAAQLDTQIQFMDETLQMLPAEKLTQYQQLQRKTADAVSQLNSVRSYIELTKQRHGNTTFEQWLAKKRNEVQCRKNELEEQIHKKDEDLNAKVAALVNYKGASIRKSFVLHCSARFLFTEYIDFLLKLVPVHERKAALNDLDTNGFTPLHCVVMGTPDLSDADLYYRTVEHLLGLGARKDITDTSGRTPLGQYRLVKRERNEFTESLCLFSNNTNETLKFHQGMEEILMPIGGETEADREADVKKSDASSDDDMDFGADSDIDSDIDMDDHDADGIQDDEDDADN